MRGLIYRFFFSRNARNEKFSQLLLPPETTPVELVFEIIAIIAPEDDDHNPPEYIQYVPASEREAISTLAAASLVSRAWNAICRRYMFGRVCVSTKNPSARLSFVHFEAPHLSEYIRKLHLWWNKDSCTAAEWFPECFCRLRNLRQLDISGVSGGNLNLSTAPAPLATGIVTMLACPCLRKLVLCEFMFAKDASDLLSILPATLEELSLVDIKTIDDNDAPMKKPSTLRLEALRTLELTDICHPMLRFNDFIECPKLKCFIAGWTRDEVWEMPPWVPLSFSELKLDAELGGNIPVLDPSIQPAVVTITLGGSNPYLSLFNWVKDCLNCFHSPNLIRVLTINVINDRELATLSDAMELYPHESEYEVLSQFLEPFCSDGCLKTITLKILKELNSTDVDLPADRARELAKLKNGFAALFRLNVLDVYFEGCGDGTTIRLKLP